jgi:preprotein translocase subunit SecG
MKTTKIIAMIIAILFLVMGFAMPTIMAKDLKNDGPDQDQPTTSEAEVKLFFRGQGITPTRPTGNQSEETTACPGRLYGGRWMGTEIGIWSMGISQDATVAGSVSISIYARSQGGAKNAGFRINLYRNNGNMQAFFTNRQDIGPTEVEFTAEGTYNQQFNGGDTFDAQLVWLSDPRMGVGPSGAGEFVYGNAAYDSSVKVVFSPHPITVHNTSVPDINKETMSLRTEFSDYLHSDPHANVYMITVGGAGTASPSNLEGPNPSGGSGNVSTVSWVWTHKADGAKSGEYNIVVSISYDGNSSATCSTTLKIKIPSGSGGGGGSLFGGDGDFDIMLLVYILVAVIIVAIVVVVVMKKVKKKKKAEEDEDEED